MKSPSPQTQEPGSLRRPTLCKRQAKSSNLAASIAALILVSLAPLGPVRAEEYVFPSDSGVINVKTDLVSRGIHTSNAAGNGSTDDRAAIQAAINWAIDNLGRYATAKFLYFPNGTYRISDTIQSRVGTNWRAGMILIGQSTTATIIKLDNNASGFGDAASRKSMIITGSENPNNPSEAEDGSGNEAFRHQIRNMTIDIGSGNLGAVALDFNASNRGTVKDVLIRSSDASKRGHIGLELRKNGDGVGPLLIKNVTIDGFEYGIVGNNSTFSSTFENITVKNQSIAGVLPGGSMFTFRDLTSINTVAAVSVTSNLGHTTIIGGSFTGGASGAVAVRNDGKMLLRDISSSGYGTVIDNNSGGSPDVPGGSGTITVSEYSSHPVETLFSAAQLTTLRLPIEETPTYSNNNFTQWANVESFGATKNDASNDDSIGIQAAIDSGASVVYLPLGTYDVSNQIIIRNNVRLFIGFESVIVQKAGYSDPQLVRFDSTSSTIIRNVNIFGSVVHNSSGTLAMVHCDIGRIGLSGADFSYSNSSAGSGKTFIEDCIVSFIRLTGPGHRFWARQLNCEHNVTEIRNDGATAWILGFKTEKPYNIITALNGSRTEVFGGHFYAESPAASTTPCIDITDSAASINFGVYQNAYPLLVRETQAGVTREALRADMPTRGNGSSVPLFVAGSMANATPVTVADYQFTSGSLTSSDTDANSTASVITSGGGSGYTISATAVSGRLRSTTTDNNPNGNDAKLNNGQSFGFTVTAGSGRILNLKSFTLGTRRNGNSPNRITVYATKNGTSFVTVIDTSAVGTTTAFNTLNGGDLGTEPELQNAASVEFVVVYHGGSTGITNGVDDTDNIAVAASVVAGAPTPGAGPVVVADYQFSSGSLTSSDTDANSAASTITTGGGSGHTLSATVISGRLRATTSDNNPNGNDAKLNNGQSLGFTVTAASGKTLSLESFTLGSRREGNSPDKLTVYASADGTNFVTLIDSVVIGNTTAFASLEGGDLTTVPELQGVTSAEFAIVYHGGSTGLTNGRDDTDNIVVTASVD